MISRRSIRLAVLCAAGVAILAPGAAAPSTGWAPALPGYRFSFPADYGAHEKTQDEWWYYTGNLRDTSGQRFGFELTIFRYGVQHPIAHGSAWDIDDLYFAHFAVTDVDGGRFFWFDRSGRATLGFAGASAGDERAWVGKWQVERSGDGSHYLRAKDNGAAVELRLTPRGDPVMNGLDGVSRKGSCSTCASHYYSLPRLRVDGVLVVGGHSHTVSGLAWNDHEWGSNELATGIVGWDWFSMQLDNRTEIMLYRLRRNDGTTAAESSGTAVESNGKSNYIPSSDFAVAATGTWVSPHDGARYPSSWRVTVGRERALLKITPLLSDQELTTERSTHVAYWEGACEIRGTYGGRPVHGYGYTELTGYAAGGLGSLR